MLFFTLTLTILTLFNVLVYTFLTIKKKTLFLTYKVMQRKNKSVEEAWCEKRKKKLEAQLMEASCHLSYCSCRLTKTGGERERASERENLTRGESDEWAASAFTKSFSVALRPHLHSYWSEVLQHPCSRLSKQVKNEELQRRTSILQSIHPEQPS